jgi:hypothetical protein
MKMKQQIWRNQDIPPIQQQIEAAFAKKADSASILQGVRPFRTGLPHVRVVLFPSPKNEGHFIACEGRLEGDAALCFELDPIITEYRGQGIMVPGPNNRPLVPDFILRLSHLFAVVDIKPYGRLKSPSVTARMRWIGRELADVGIPHYTFTERELQKQPLMQIRGQLRKGQTTRLTPDKRNELKASMKEKPMPVGKLRNRAIELGLPPYAVEHLAITNELTFPLNKRWTESTLIGANNHVTDRKITTDWGTVHDLRLAI